MTIAVDLGREANKRTNKKESGVKMLNLIWIQLFETGGISERFLKLEKILKYNTYRIGDQQKA